MEQHQKCQNNSSIAKKKKEYRKPILTILGKVSELTAGGSAFGAELDERGQMRPGHRAERP